MSDQWSDHTDTSVVITHAERSDVNNPVVLDIPALDEDNIEIVDKFARLDDVLSTEGGAQ